MLLNKGMNTFTEQEDRCAHRVLEQAQDRAASYAQPQDQEAAVIALLQIALETALKDAEMHDAAKTVANLFTTGENE
jgi:hypothetical protein